MENIILDIQKISKSFSEGRQKNSYDQKALLSNVSIQIPRGKITALTGGNGTGKTTLFNIISGFTEPDKGNILYLNGNMPKSLLSYKPEHRRMLGIGRLFQEINVFEELTILENLIIAEINKENEKPLWPFIRPKQLRNSEKQAEEKAYGLINRFLGAKNDIWEKRNQKIKNVSYGQQRLVELIRLFLGGNRLVLLDEPTSGIHQEIIDNMALILDELAGKDELTIFIIEHNLDFVKNIADYCAFISNGTVDEFGDPHKVLEHEKVKTTYFGL